MNKEIQNKKSSEYSILIVDDDRDVLDLIKDVLEDDRFNLVTKQDSKQALKIMDDHKFDIIITDLMMPGIDGMQLINAAKEKNADCKAIVITGHASVDSAVQALQLGVFDYVNKPINQAEIKNIVERSLENLDLQLANKKLHKKNERILSNLTLLIEINKILFQVTDINHAFEMVLDTLTDYFKIEKCAIFMEDIETGIFDISLARKLDPDFMELKFSLAEKVNNTNISRDRETVIHVPEGLITFNQKQIKCASGYIVFSPVTFQDFVMGYILIHLDNEKCPAPELLAMVNILALQIAPLMNTFNKNRQKTHLETNITYMIRERIEMAKDILSPISFALLRPVFFSPSGDGFAYKNLIGTLQQYIAKNIPDEFILHWQSQDTALLIMPEVDYFKAETFCKNLKNLTENNYQPNETGAKVDLNFSCLGYPEAGNTAREITDHLWVKLLQEISFAEREHLVIN
ncbi:MAG: response regulator [Calditrichae bacterium]|nr:response regulator [Calditrichia bacterium]